MKDNYFAAECVYRRVKVVLLNGRSNACDANGSVEKAGGKKVRSAGITQSVKA